MIKKLLLILLLLIPIVSATTFYTNKPATLFTICKNQTYVESTATLSVYFPNSSILIDNATMTVISQGKFNHTFIPTAEGNYLAYSFCNISNVIGVAEESFFVLEEIEMIGTEISNVGRIIFLVFMFAIHFILLIVGMKFKLKAVIVMGAILGTVASVTAITQIGTTALLGATLFFSAYALFSIGLTTLAFWFEYKKNDE